MPGVQSRRFCFTWNNKDTNDVAQVLADYEDQIQYLVCGDEIAPSTGTPHVQGYIEIKKKKTIAGLQKWFKNSVSLFIANGNATENTTYCTKSSMNIIRHGTPMAQGSRFDIADFHKMVKEKGEISEIADEDPANYYRYHAAVDKILREQRIKDAPAVRDMRVEIYWGLPGRGKTYKATGGGSADYYAYEAPYQWFDGYTGQKTLLIDDYNSDIPITQLLKICDGRKKFKCNVKGSFVWAEWTKVVFTSNIPPGEWHMKAKRVHREALRSRVDYVEEVTGPDRRRRTYAYELVEPDAQSHPIVYKEDGVVISHT